MRRHDMAPDGRTGPFNRTQHYHNRNDALLHDSRCGACREELRTMSVRDVVKAVERSRSERVTA